MYLHLVIFVSQEVLFLHTNLGDALYLDGLVNSRPVVMPVAVPNIDTFDDIVYKKGSSLLNMLKNTYPAKYDFNTGIKVRFLMYYTPTHAQPILVHSLFYFTVFT
jgi:aminopeptidase N